MERLNGSKGVLLSFSPGKKKWRAFLLQAQNPLLFAFTSSKASALKFYLPGVLSPKSWNVMYLSLLLHVVHLFYISSQNFSFYVLFYTLELWEEVGFLLKFSRLYMMLFWMQRRKAWNFEEMMEGSQKKKPKKPNLLADTVFSWSLDDIVNERLFKNKVFWGYLPNLSRNFSSFDVFIEERLRLYVSFVIFLNSHCPVKKKLKQVKW